MQKQHKSLVSAGFKPAIDLNSRDFMQGKINSLGEFMVLLRKFYRTQMPMKTRSRRHGSRKIMA